MQLVKFALMLDLIARATLVVYLNKRLALRLKSVDISSKGALPELADII